MAVGVTIGKPGRDREETDCDCSYAQSNPNRE
jgi:hypothetical protein